jgi:hypothetical protein
MFAPHLPMGSHGKIGLLDPPLNWLSCMVNCNYSLHNEQESRPVGYVQAETVTIYNSR